MRTRTSEHTAQDIERLGPWFHNLHLPDGTQTAPNHWLGDFPRFKWERIERQIPEDLHGWTALDIGCNAGYYAIELAKRGAQVTGIDHDPKYLAQARWAVDVYGLGDRIDLKQMQVYELIRLREHFDLVLFMGVLYHLRYPMLALDIVARTQPRLLVFQTLMLPGEECAVCPSDIPFGQREALRAPGWPTMAFVEHAFAGDPTNWWIANRAAAEAMLRAAGFRILDRPEPEVLLCEPRPAARDELFPGNAYELEIATGLRSSKERS